MSAKSPSTLVYEFVAALVAAAGVGTALDDAAVLDSPYQDMTGDKGLIVSNAEWEFSPKQTAVDLYDALVVLAFYVRIPGTDTSERLSKRDLCFQMAEAVSWAVYGDVSLGGRICDCLMGRLTDGFRNVGSDSYAVINLPITLNPTGGPLDFNLGEAR